jgi:hypothetical protein
MKKSKTRHDGFFISSGKLELRSDRNIVSHKNNKKYIPTKDLKNNAEMNLNNLSNNGDKNEFENSDSNNNVANNDNNANDNIKTILKSSKPLWDPTNEISECLKSLSIYKLENSNLFAKLTKNNITFPKPFEDLLLNLNKIVFLNHNKTGLLKKTSGYYESILEIVAVKDFTIGLFYKKYLL